MYGDSSWFTFFPPSSSETKRIAERPREFAPPELSEYEALDATAVVFGYSSYLNLLEYLAFDWAYPHKWDDEIDMQTTLDRRTLQTSSLAECLRISLKDAVDLLERWKPSSRTDWNVVYDVHARMKEAQSELTRLGRGRDTEYFKKLRATFRPYKPAMCRAMLLGQQEAPASPLEKVETKPPLAPRMTLLLLVDEVKRRAKDLRKLIQQEGLNHNRALDVVAKMCNFRDYQHLVHEMSKMPRGLTRAWDENLTAEELACRRRTQVEMLSNALKLDAEDVNSLLDAWRPTANFETRRQLHPQAPPDVLQGDVPERANNDASTPVMYLVRNSAERRPVITVKRHRHALPIEDR